MADRIGLAGTALGSVSLFAQLVNGCIQAFSVWQKGKEIGSDAVTFQVRMEMQAARLKEWAYNWGIGHGTTPLHLFEPRFRDYGDLAVQYIATINYLLNILDQFAGDHPVVASASNFPLTAASHIARLGELGDTNSSGHKILLEKINSLQDDARTLERLDWRTDEAWATKSLEMIREMINDLYCFFEPPRKDGTAHIVFNACLASMNLSQLDNLRLTCKEDRLLQGLAYLKTTSEKLSTRGSALDSTDVNKKYRLLKDKSPPDSRNSRSWDTFEGHMVMVEWKKVAAAPESLQYVLLASRIRNIARLLKSELKPDELRTLSCLGVVTKSDPQSVSSQHGLLFQIPSAHSKTLMSLLSGGKATLTLGNLFTIAQKLSEALLFLHLAGWLHKGIRNENILFFGSDQDRMELDNPRIVGFEHSRESRPDSMTEGVADDLEYNLYRHPEVQGVPEQPLSVSEEASQTKRPPFSQKHDVYSLGVTLIEIGSMKSAVQIMREAEADPGYGAHSAANFALWLRQKELPKLGLRMGAIYRDAVDHCLTGTFAGDGTYSAETGFYLKVVRPLAECRV